MSTSGTNAKYQAKVTVKFNKVLQKDEHIVFNTYGNDLEELNTNAKEMIADYKTFNGINATAEYFLFETPGAVASTLNAIGKV